MKVRHPPARVGWGPYVTSPEYVVPHPCISCAEIYRKQRITRVEHRNSSTLTNSS